MINMTGITVVKRVQSDVQTKKSSVVRVTEATSATVPKGITRYGENKAETQKADFSRHRMKRAKRDTPFASTETSESRLRSNFMKG